MDSSLTGLILAIIALTFAGSITTIALRISRATKDKDKSNE